MKNLYLLLTIVFFAICQVNINGQDKVPVQIDQSTLILMDEINALFYQSSVLFINFKDVDASVELKKASDLILKISKKLPEHLQAEVTSSANEVKKLMMDVSDLKVDNIQRLKRTYARTFYTLARCYFDITNENLDKNDYLNSVIALETSSNYLANGILWIGYVPGKQTRAIRKSIHNINIAVTSRNEIDKEELDKVKKYIHQELMKLGNKINEVKKEYDTYEIKI
ncbi:hypothetical protein ACFLTE_04825 [Bacteroidota bacterium]